MHPVVVLAPALVLIFGPRLWVGHVLNRHNKRDLPRGSSAGELARELLDRHRLQTVRVESTDLGDHYDPATKAVRLARDKINRRTLTALTTAAHEVAHAMQDASGYAPFVWRTRLVKVAQVTGDMGAVLLLSVPVTAVLTRNPIPPVVVGAASLAMLGTGVVAQLAALPSELDASFARALPMLREGHVDDAQLTDARKILLACSLTYVASSLVAVLYVWPWLGRLGPVYAAPNQRLALATVDVCTHPLEGGRKRVGWRADRSGVRMQPRIRVRGETGHRIKKIAKPLIRGWLRLSEVI